jgi:hypothetical protein
MPPLDSGDDSITISLSSSSCICFLSMSLRNWAASTHVCTQQVQLSLKNIKREMQDKTKELQMCKGNKFTVAKHIQEHDSYQV